MAKKTTSTAPKKAAGTNGVPRTDYIRRRDAVLAELKGAAAIVLAGGHAPPLRGVWRADAMFSYLTGIDDEPQAAVLFDPANEDPRRRVVLFLSPANPETDRWDGYRPLIDSRLRAAHGFETIMRLASLPAMLTAAARRSGKLACLHPFAVYDAPVSPDLALLRKVTERVVGVSIVDQTRVLPRMRAVKSAAEIALISRAVGATAAGHAALLRALRPGVSERALHTALERAFTDAGATGLAYNPIVGSGLNATVLHYNASSGVCAGGELLLVDAAAECDHYCADVTRTYPVSGRFTADQRALYELVLRALDAGIRTARAGVRIVDIDMASRAVIEKAGLGDAFIHGIGHHLGLEVHDSNPEDPLPAGAVITIEPGVYLADRTNPIGIRIEDDILVTKGGRTNLTATIPRSAPEIEDIMRRARRSD